MFYRLRKKEGVEEIEKKKEGGEKIGENCREGKKKTRGRKNWEKMWQMGENQNFGYCNRNF